MTERWRARLVLFAVASSACAAPALSEVKPRKPSLAIEPITARNLLAPADRDWKLSLTQADRERQARSYRLGDEVNGVTGQRARLSVEIGDTRLFAMTGRLSDEPSRPAAAPDYPQAIALGQRKGSAKVYGGGFERLLGPVELSATYQYSRVNAERSESNLKLDNPRSHSIRATARIRFKH